MIKQSDKLANVNYAIRGPVLDAAYALEAQGETVLKLNIGNPGVFGFNMNQNVVDTIAQNILGTNGGQSYSHSKGIIEARETIANYHQKAGIKGVTADDIFMGNGASELITMSMQGLVNPGDEVLVPAPDYPLWTASVNLAGGTAVHYLCDEDDDWNPNIADMSAKINEKTKAIVIINPNNPTGAVYSKEVLEQIVELARKNSLIIYSDEIYDRILYGEAVHIPIATLSEDVPTFTFNGISKTHLACGIRGGWLVVSGDKSQMQDYIDGLTTLSSMRLCSNVPAQYACKAALEEDHDYERLRISGGRLYEQATKAAKALNEIDGISCVPAKGALYLFPKIDAEKFNITNDQQFMLDFLMEKKVLLVNGTGFNWATPDHFRVVILPNEDELLDAIERLKDFLVTYKQA